MTPARDNPLRTGRGAPSCRHRLQTALVALWLTLSITGVALSWVAWHRVANQVELGVRTVELNGTLDRLLVALLDAETAQRGFIITGEEPYLAPLQNAELVLSHEFGRLAELGRGDPELGRHARRLEQLSGQRMDLLRRNLTLRREQGLPAAAAALATGEELRLMSQIREVETRQRQTRPGLLALADARTRHQLRRAFLTSLAAGIMGIVAGLFAYYLTRLGLAHERHERELAEAKLRAESSNEKKSSFLANMSHEIRTPMNAILGFTDLLAGELREPKPRRYLAAIRTAAGSLLELINDVLDLSKIEAGLLELNPEPTDPRELCGFLRTVFAEQATKKGVLLSCEAAADLPGALLLDRTRLRQVLVNLVGNAVKFTETGSIRLRIGGEPQPGPDRRLTLLIEVEDTGIGIEPERLDAVFKPFVQANPLRLQERQGTGLGLAIVRRLTELMGGGVTVTSVVGRGSTFRIRLPDVAAATAPSDPPAASGSPAGLDFNDFAPATLLVVDDNELNRQLIAGIFEGTHHRVHFGADGRAGVDLTRSLRPQVVLMDIRMPVLDGRTALALIRQIPGCERLPVIAVTASSGNEEERELRERFSGYIRKPFSQRRLFDELAGFLPRVAPPAGPARPGGGPGEGWAGLAAELRRLESADWPEVRAGLAIRQVEAFAQRIGARAEAAACPPAAGYAATLLRLAAAYDVPALERELDRFPEIIAALESRAVEPEQSD